MLCGSFSIIAVRNGYSCVPVALSEGLNIKLNTAVKQIRYTTKGVEITTTKGRNAGNTVTYTGEEYLLLVCIFLSIHGPRIGYYRRLANRNFQAFSNHSYQTVEIPSI